MFNTKLDFNNIVVRHNGRTISIAQHWEQTEDGDFLDTQEILDLGGKSAKTKNIRSATPRGFARAVYEFNSMETV
jgi:hypothetical protein